jgi:methionine-rich copper-binding protein CopC
MTSLALLVTSAPAALAHDELVTASPDPGATLPSPPRRVELGFSGPIQPLGTQVLVTGPDGAAVSAGAVQIRDTTVVQPLAGALASGTYRVRWRATSSDGHQLSGRHDFIVIAGATPPRETGERAVGLDQRVDETAGDEPSGSSPPVGWIAVGTLVLIGGGLLTARRWA